MQLQVFAWFVYSPRVVSRLRGPANDDLSTGAPARWPGQCHSIQKLPLRLLPDVAKCQIRQGVYF